MALKSAEMAGLAVPPSTLKKAQRFLDSVAAANDGYGYTDTNPTPTMINTATMTVEEQITTEAGGHTTAYDARRQRLYVFLPSCRVAIFEENEGG